MFSELEKAKSIDSDSLVHMAVCLLYWMVVNHTDPQYFHDAISLVSDLYKGFQATISYKEFAKITTGFKILVGFLCSCLYPSENVHFSCTILC